MLKKIKNIFRRVFEKGGIKGEYDFYTLGDHIKEDSQEIKLLREYIKTKNLAILEHLKNIGAILNIQHRTNIIPTTGLNVLARILAGDTTYTGEINYGAIGTAVSPSFTVASTQLGSEQFRKLASSSSFDDGIAYTDWFIANGDCANTTYTEFGAFIDGTAGANTGRAWSLLATGGWVKSGSIFISAKYTISNA